MAIAMKNLRQASWYNRMYELSADAGGTIPGNRLVEVGGSDTFVVGTVDSHAIVGVNVGDVSRGSGQTVDIGLGFRQVVTASPVLRGKPIKCADNGRVTQHVNAAAVGTTIKTTGAGLGFTNQPANDGVEILSSNNVADIGQTVTIIGTTNGGVVVVVEDIVLNGTTPVASVKVDWGVILAVKVSAALVGTLTVREASAGQTITTIAPAALSSGVETVAAAAQGAFNQLPVIVGSAATTKVLGYKYVTTAAADAYEAKALNGATDVTMVNAALLIEEVYTGDLEAARTATVKVGAEEDENHKVGKAYETAAAAGVRIWAFLTP